MKLTINGIEYSNPILVFALKSEAGNEFDDCEKIFTGIGKVNATFRLLKYLQNEGNGVELKLLLA